MDDRSFRKLSRLQDSAASSRVLNLLATWQRNGPSSQFSERPLLENKILNRSIILKHHLRPDERSLFKGPRVSATKIIIPIDAADLKAGGYSIFIGEALFEPLLQRIVGSKLGRSARDREVLKILDALPSFDPFLLREALAKKGIDVAPCYFELSAADSKALRTFAANEVSGLVDLSFADKTSLSALSERLVNKILATKQDQQLEPLRLTMKLSPSEFEEGLFCWKGFLYYKWAQDSILSQVQDLISGILNIKTSDRLKSDIRDDVKISKLTLRKAVINALEQIEKIMNIYDQAYSELVTKGNPKSFREFLLTAPNLFQQLGGQLAVVNHMCHFWAYRFHGRYANPQITGVELMDLFNDFQQGLSLSGTPREMTWSGQLQ